MKQQMSEWMDGTTLNSKISSKAIGVKLCLCRGPDNHLDHQYLAFRLLKEAEETPCLQNNWERNRIPYLEHHYVREQLPHCDLRWSQHPDSHCKLGSPRILFFPLILLLPKRELSTAASLLHFFFLGEVNLPSSVVCCAIPKRPALALEIFKYDFEKWVCLRYKSLQSPRWTRLQCWKSLNKEMRHFLHIHCWDEYYIRFLIL